MVSEVLGTGQLHVDFWLVNQSEFEGGIDQQLLSRQVILVRSCQSFLLGKSFSFDLVKSFLLGKSFLFDLGRSVA